MIDYLAIGHICADLQPDGSTRLGGTALFAALAAHRLGLRAAILTACAPDFDLSELPPDLPVLRQASPETTIFENRYTSQGRTQFLHGRAAPVVVAPEELPRDWQSPSIVHLAPIIQETPLDVATLFPRALIGATPQGWLRSVQPSRQVITTPRDLVRLPLDTIHAIVFSEEDVQNDEEIVQELAQQRSLVGLTRAERGATVFVQGTPIDVAAFPADVLDPTGAGDVFAAAFFAALHKHDDPVQAARWACAAAACAIEGVGIDRLPGPDQVQARLNQNAPG